MGKPVVHLRVYRSKNGSNQISYDANGNVQNESQSVKEIHNTLQWTNYLRHIGVHGFIKVDVEKVIQDGKELPTEAIQKEVNEALSPSANVPQTPEQKRIAELEAKLEALINGNKPTSKIEQIKSNNKSNEDAPQLPAGKTLEDLKRGELEELFPNVADLEPKNKAEFLDQVKAKYPNLK